MDGWPTKALLQQTPGIIYGLPLLDQISDKSINMWTGQDVEDDRPVLPINHPHLDKIGILTFKQCFG